MTDYQAAVDDLVDRVLNGPGELEASMRQAAARNDGLPPALAAYVDKVHRHAYRVLDEDVADLVAAGYSERQVFELTHAAAFGAGRDRLALALATMNEER
jgi:alkylhydroperoxidase family enzyme